MRRTVGLVLAGLGAFLIVLTIVLPTYIGPSVKKFPLNEYETATLTASNATYFSPSRLSVLTGANLEAKYTVKGSGVGDSTRATWELFNSTYDSTNGIQLPALYRKFTFDRKTTQIINCCGSAIEQGGTVVGGAGTGNVGYVFPINSQRTTYMVFDTTTLRPEPFAYSGTDTIDGIDVYKYTESVPPTKIGFLPLSATNPEYVTEHVVFWIDPSTGAILNVDQQTHRYLGDPNTGSLTLEVFNADLKFTPATIAYVVGLDNNGRGTLQLLNIILPLTFGFLGVVALAAGVLLYRSGNPGPADRDVAAALAAIGAEQPADGPVAAAERPPSPRHAAPEPRPAEPSNVSMIPGMDSKPDETTGQGAT